jgi:hypothetical protein
MDRYSSLAAKEIGGKSGKAGIYSLTVKPTATFVKMYFLRRGFLDGIHGIMLAVLYSFYTFLKYAKTWEKQGNSKNK